MQGERRSEDFKCRIGAKKKVEQFRALSFWHKSCRACKILRSFRKSAKLLGKNFTHLRKKVRSWKKLSNFNDFLHCVIFLLRRVRRTAFNALRHFLYAVRQLITRCV